MIQQLWAMVGRGVPTASISEDQPCAYPTSLNSPGWTRPDQAALAATGPPNAVIGRAQTWGGRSHSSSCRRAGRGEEEEEVEQQKEDKVQHREDICSPPWWLCTSCSGLFTAVVFGRTSPWLSPVADQAPFLPLHPCSLPGTTPSTGTPPALPW